VHYKPTELDRTLLTGRNPLLMNKPDDFDALLGFAAFQRPLITRPIVEYLGERAVKDRALHERIFNEVLFEGLNLLLPDLPRIKTPTLILWGAKDRVLHPDNAKIFQQYIPGSRLQIFEGVGHIAMAEIPELCAVAVLQFIASSTTEAGAAPQ
jgi:abhydrolase domain-containing protein 6